MIIIGAGMAGLLAGHMFRSHAPDIWEQQSSLPNNHDALLRFRTDKVSKATGIPFRKVLVRKEIECAGQSLDKPNAYACNQYSLKVTGRVLDRSIWNMEPAERYIAPSNFIKRMSNGLRIGYNVRVSGFPKETLENHAVVSTIPMPVMMDIMGYKHKPKFAYSPIWTVSAEIYDPFVDVYQTIHYADIADPVYRVSLTGNIITIEMMEPPAAILPEDEQLDLTKFIQGHLNRFGIFASKLARIKVSHMPYGKIVPIDNDQRQEFIYNLTRDRGIYSLGRFATWRQILLDDVVDDCEVIGKLAGAEARRSLYHASIAASN